MTDLFTAYPHVDFFNSVSLISIIHIFTSIITITIIFYKLINICIMKAIYSNDGG